MTLFEQLIQDVRYTARQLAGSPGFTAVAMLAFALGIGAATTVFMLVNAVLLKPLPFDRAGDLYRVGKKSPGGTDRWLAVPEFTGWQQESRWGAAIAGFTPMDFNLRGVNPESLMVVWASQNFLPVLRIEPRLGRGFTDADFHAGAEPTALISHELWQRRYGADPAIVGSHADLEGPAFLSESSGRYTIIGVLPDTFWLFYSRTDFVIPMRGSPAQLADPNRRFISTVIARAGDASAEVVRADVERISRQVARDHEAAGEAAASWSITVDSLQEWHFGDLRQPLRMLMGTALLVALTACANVALFLIARTNHRRRELTIRLAIGAERARIVRQLLTESVLLACIGGVLGILLAAAGMRVVAILIPAHVVSRLPGGVDSLSLDHQVVLVALGVSLLSGLCAGLGAISASRCTRASELLETVWPAGSTAGRQPVQSILVVAQAALAVMLLVAGSLLMQSLLRMQAVDLGIEPRKGLVVWLNLNVSRYPDDEQRVRFYEAVFERLRREPDVTHASGVDMPFNLEWQTTRFATESTTEAQPERWPEALARAVTPTYFHRHGIRAVQGRTFTDQDDARAASVVIISQALANRLWPGEAIAGRSLRIVRGWAPPVVSTIVGVVSDIRSAPHAQPQPIIYRPVQQVPPPWMYVTVEGDPQRADLLGALRRAVWAVDPDQPLDGPSGPWTLAEWISERTEQPRLLAALGNALATIALVLAAMSVHGLLSYTVARRTPEIGLRMALGATPARIVRQILRQPVTLTICGVAVGLAASASLARFFESLLFGIAPLDPATFAAAALVFVMISAVAALVPIRRAMSVSPLVALRSE
jgi:putative ABC transport system permease protein